VPCRFDGNHWLMSDIKLRESSALGMKRGVASPDIG
jgi:hypothetical protein